MINNQLPEKQINDVFHLAVNSIFYTIQGEGPFAGRPAIFIRLAGCNLQCPLCDTEYTNRTKMTVSQIEEEVFALQERGLVVITGGEPYRQNLNQLIKRLIYRGNHVQIETNGTLYQELDYFAMDLTIVCSPKAGRIHPKLEPHITAYKYVATAQSLVNSNDGLPTHALEHPTAKGLARPKIINNRNIYLQAVDEQDPIKNKANLDAVVASCLKHKYKLCIQIHKLVGVP